MRHIHRSALFIYIVFVYKNAADCAPLVSVSHAHASAPRRRVPSRSGRAPAQPAGRGRLRKRRAKCSRLRRARNARVARVAREPVRRPARQPY